MQEKAVRDNPVIIRIETETGHGTDTTSKRIALYADLWSFLMYNTGVDFK
jgi:prolyl oligopeptidase